MLSAVDEEAAHANDMVQLFRSEGRFPDVTRCRLEVDGAKDALQVTTRPANVLTADVAGVAVFPLSKMPTFCGGPDQLLRADATADFRCLDVF